MTRIRTGGKGQRGFVLVTSLLLLVVVTILAISMFRSFGIDEKIAGNTRDKQLATEAAKAEEEYAETWLLNNSPGSGPVVSANCAGIETEANSCVFPTPLGNNVSTLPWPAGIVYSPPTLGVAGATALVQPANFPTVYISLAGTSGTNGYIYQIDTVAYGANPNTVSQVEAFYLVRGINSPVN